MRLLPWLLLAVGFAGPRTLEAQLQATAVRDLAFGAVIQGVATAVAPGDPVRSGQFEIQVAQGTRLRLDFVLPTQLVRVGGGALPITFLNADCILIETGAGAVPSTQNPKSMKPYTMAFGNRLFVFLGGRITPTATQATGVYTATVALTVTVM
jgi:hypothetical protein